MDSKKCRGCRRLLHLTMFYPHRSTSDGRVVYCRRCSIYKNHKSYERKYGIVQDRKAELFSIDLILLNNNKTILKELVKELSPVEGVVLKVPTQETFKFTVRRVNDSLSVFSLHGTNDNFTCTFNRFHDQSVDGVLSILDKADLRLIKTQDDFLLFKKLYLDVI